MQTFQYGPSEDQQADLYLPEAPRPPVVCLLHGGFWRMPYARNQMSAVATDLVERGLAVWNLEYRRIGAPDTEWPATLDDVRAGIEYLATIAAGGIDLDLERVVVVGHSAGGHLALFAAGCGQPGSAAAPRVRLLAAAGLAPIADLAEAYARKVGGEAVAELLGGTPSRIPDRLRIASPMAMLPLRVRQLILHGTDDKAVPIDLSRRYAHAAAAAGDAIELTELPGMGHMEFLDPKSEAHLHLCRWLSDVMRGSGR